jgi:hypothetical protein
MPAVQESGTPSPALAANFNNIKAMDINRRT